VVLTPPLSSGCLAGITRELVVEWSREAGLDVREEPLPLEALLTCDEVFITSSTKDVLAVDRLCGELERDLEPGTVTARVAEVFAALSAERMDP
jgi:branched-chain amino acid aminotransferase